MNMNRFAIDIIDCQIFPTWSQSTYKKTYGNFDFKIKGKRFSSILNENY